MRRAKSSPLKIRYVLISDYATIDHSGKLIVAGLYTEDLVVPSVPTIFGSLVLTILAEAPANKLAFQLNLVARAAQSSWAAAAKLDRPLW